MARRPLTHFLWPLDVVIDRCRPPPERRQRRRRRRRRTLYTDLPCEVSKDDLLRFDFTPPVWHFITIPPPESRKRSAEEGGKVMANKRGGNKRSASNTCQNIIVGDYDV